MLPLCFKFLAIPLVPGCRPDRRICVSSVTWLQSAKNEVKLSLNCAANLLGVWSEGQCCFALNRYALSRRSRMFIRLVRCGKTSLLRNAPIFLLKGMYGTSRLKLQQRHNWATRQGRNTLWMGGSSFFRGACLLVDLILTSANFFRRRVSPTFFKCGRPEGRLRPSGAIIPLIRPFCRHVFLVCRAMFVYSGLILGLDSRGFFFELFGNILLWLLCDYNLSNDLEPKPLTLLIENASRNQK